MGISPTRQVVNAGFAALGRISFFVFQIGLGSLGEQFSLEAHFVLQASVSKPPRPNWDQGLKSRGCAEHFINPCALDVHVEVSGSDRDLHGRIIRIHVTMGVNTVMIVKTVMTINK